MIETPFGCIHGIEDETITMEELRNIFIAIEQGKITHISYREDINPYKERTFEISKVVRCKDCIKQNEIECPLHRVLEDGTVYSTVKSDFYCGYGEPKVGEQ